MKFVWSLVIYLCILSYTKALEVSKCFGLARNLQKARTVAAAAAASVLVFQPISTNALEDNLAIARFKQARLELVDLDKNWDSIVRGQGDNIRRRLGTVYTPPTCSPALCSFSVFVEKFVRSHPEDLNMAEFEEPARELQEALNQADFLAYSSIFSEYGNGGGGSDYMKDSRAQVKRAVSLMDEVIKSVEE